MLLSQNTISGKEISSLTRSQGYDEYVEVQCENCLNIREIKYSSYLHLQYSNNNDKKTFCKSCGPKVKLGKTIDGQIVEQIIDGYKSGLSMQKLAKNFNKSNRKIKEILSNNNIKTCERSPRRVGYKKCWKCHITQESFNFAGKGSCISCREKSFDKSKNRNFRRRPRGKWVDEWYAAQYLAQGGKCLICENSFDKLFVDHCHYTGKLRGLLCLGCNSGIGLFVESVEIMANAIEYLTGESYVA